MRGTGSGDVAAPGWTLIEVLCVVVVVGVCAAIAIPAIERVRAGVEVAGARDAFAGAHALARQVAAQYGRLARLHIDPEAGAFWVVVDTSSGLGSGIEDTVGPVVRVRRWFGGVELDSNRRRLCFDPGGLGTAALDCELPNARVVFARGATADTVWVSRLGRLRRR